MGVDFLLSFFINADAIMMTNTIASSKTLAFIVYELTKEQIRNQEVLSTPWKLRPIIDKTASVLNDLNFIG